MNPTDHADYLAECIDNIVATWESGNLAEAVNEAEAAAAAWRADYADMVVPS